MKRFQMMVAAAALAALALARTASAQTTVVTFDDLPATGQFAVSVPTGYGGISWQGGNWEYLICGASNPCPDFSGDPYPYTPHSYPGMVTVDSLIALTMQFGFVNGPQVFNGAWVSTFDGDYFGYVLKLGGSTVYTSALATTGSVPTFVASGYAGAVDQVVIVASDIGDWIMDDMSYTALPVPEPSTWALMAGGLAGIAGLRLRLRRRNGR